MTWHPDLCPRCQHVWHGIACIRHTYDLDGQRIPCPCVTAWEGDR